MYESLLLESGKVFIGRRVYGIGANVVDDSRTITIPVVIPEGEAEIVSITAPPTFTPGVPFHITIAIKNIGTYVDSLFVRATNVDTGDRIDRRVDNVGAGEIVTLMPFVITLVQETDFHCLIEAGHVED